MIEGDDTPLRRLDIHRALSRPSLLLGADRELVLLTGLLTVVLVFVVLTATAAALGLALWASLVGVLRAMAKKDALLRPIYLRHIRYRLHYAPMARPWRRA